MHRLLYTPETSFLELKDAMLTIQPQPGEQVHDMPEVPADDDDDDDIQSINSEVH